MRATLAAAALLAAAPAGAQLSNHVVGVETGAAAEIGARGAGALPVALCAGTWLEGDVEAILRLSWAASPRTAGRGAASTLGVRWSLLPAPVRPQLHAEAGWAWGLRGTGRSGAVVGAGAGVEVFVARDVSVGLRATVRAVLGVGADAGAAAGASFYF